MHHGAKAENGMQGWVGGVVGCTYHPGARHLPWEPPPASHQAEGYDRPISRCARPARTGLVADERHVPRASRPGSADALRDVTGRVGLVHGSLPESTTSPEEAAPSPVRWRVTVSWLKLSGSTPDQSTMPSPDSLAWNVPIVTRVLRESLSHAW